MFWKIFSGVWLCSWKYHRKHIFYLLLTFSQLSNKYIILFLNTETQKKQNPEKKNSSNPVKLREEGRERGDWVEARSHDKGEGDTIRPGSSEMSLRRWDQTGGAVGRGLDLGFTGDSSLRPSAWAWREWWEWVRREIFWVDQCDCESELVSFFFLYLSLCALMSPKMVWSENENVNQFLGQSVKTHSQIKWFSRKFYFSRATKHTMTRKTIFWNTFTPKQNVAFVSSIIAASLQGNALSFRFKSMSMLLIIYTYYFFLGPTMYIFFETTTTPTPQLNLTFLFFFFFFCAHLFFFLISFGFFFLIKKVLCSWILCTIIFKNK